MIAFSECPYLWLLTQTASLPALLMSVVLPRARPQPSQLQRALPQSRLLPDTIHLLLLPCSRTPLNEAGSLYIRLEPTTSYPIHAH